MLPELVIFNEKFRSHILKYHYKNPIHDTSFEMHKLAWYNNYV